MYVDPKCHILLNNVKSRHIDSFESYITSKFIQRINAQYWARELGASCRIIIVSPGNQQEWVKDPRHPLKAKSPVGGEELICQGFTRKEFPKDVEQIYLSAREWLSTETSKITLDKQLQDKWSPSKEDIEKDEGWPCVHKD